MVELWRTLELLDQMMSMDEHCSVLRLVAVDWCRTYASEWVSEWVREGVSEYLLDSFVNLEGDKNVGELGTAPHTSCSSMTHGFGYGSYVPGPKCAHSSSFVGLYGLVNLKENPWFARENGRISRVRPNILTGFSENCGKLSGFSGPLMKQVSKCVSE